MRLSAIFAQLRHIPMLLATASLAIHLVLKDALVLVQQAVPSTILDIFEVDHPPQVPALSEVLFLSNCSSIVFVTQMSGFIVVLGVTCLIIAIMFAWRYRKQQLAVQLDFPLEPMQVEAMPEDSDVDSDDAFFSAATSASMMVPQTYYKGTSSRLEPCESSDDDCDTDQPLLAAV